MSLVIRRAAADEVRPLRNLVLRGVTPGTVAAYDLEPLTVHVGAFDEARQCVGTVSIFPKPYEGDPVVPDAWMLRGMAVAREHRGHKIGGRLLDAAIAIVRAADVSLLWADGRMSALGFYTDAGWTPVGEEFMHTESGVLHQKILLPLR
jgi:GNAT superfamily N-acetyltransferase